MDLEALEVKVIGQAIQIPVKVVPGSSKTRIAGLLGAMLKVNIAAAPEKGKANKELQRYLADLLGISKSQVVVVAGEHHPQKELRIDKIDKDTFFAKLKDVLNER